MKKNKTLPIKINLMWLFIFSVPVFISLILLGGYSHLSKMFLITIGVLFYVILALLHHFFNRSLKVEIVIEYILIAALALMIIQSLLN